MITFLAGFIAFPITAIAAQYAAEAWEHHRNERTEPWKHIRWTGKTERNGNGSTSNTEEPRRVVER